MGNWYHGSTFLGNRKITEERRFITFGPRQCYHNDRDTNPLSTQFGHDCGTGAYFSFQIEIAYELAEKNENGETCVFEVRLKPSEVRIPDMDPRLAIVNDYKYARPTGICIRRSLKK